MAYTKTHYYADDATEYGCLEDAVEHDRRRKKIENVLDAYGIYVSGTSIIEMVKSWRGILNNLNLKERSLTFEEYWHNNSYIIDGLLLQGLKIHAIKHIRSEMDIGLKDAKDAIEKYMYSNPTLNKKVKYLEGYEEINKNP